MMSVSGDHEEFIKLLIDKGANINAKDKNGKTALMKAAEYDKSSVIEILLKAGANIDEKDNNGWTALIWAETKGDKKTVDMLVKAGADTTIFNDVTLLIYSAKIGDIEKVKKLIDKGVNVNAYASITNIFDRNNIYTALMGAVRGGHTDIVKLLIKNGADVNLEDYISSMLNSATMKGDVDIVKMLLDAGADANKQDIFSTTALNSAASACYFDIVKMLLDAGADVNNRDIMNGTALISSASAGCFDIVKMLVDHGADIQSGRKNAIETASNKGHEEIANYLLNRLIEPKIKAGDYDFRKTVWGMSVVEVKKAEKGVVLHEEDYPSSMMNGVEYISYDKSIFYHVNLLGHTDTILEYNFIDNKLVEAEYKFSDFKNEFNCNNVSDKMSIMANKVVSGSYPIV